MRRLALLLLAVCIAAAAEARIGGGDSYSGSDSSSSSSDSSYSSSDYDSGSSSSSSGSSGDADPGAMLFVFLIFGGMTVFSVITNAAARPSSLSLTVTHAPAAPVTMTALRQFDPNFSEVVFTDFCYSLFARLYDALGRGRVDELAPYVAAEVRSGLKEHAPPGLTAIKDLVIGSFTISGFSGIDRPQVEAKVDIEANYTEVAGGVERRWYVREEWTLTRARDLLSPRPEQARADHCPKCGAALETRTDGACLHCGTVIKDGSFQWYLQSINGLSKDERPPTLGGGSGEGGPERGLERPTVIQPWIGRQMQTFATSHPDFTWDGFEARVRQVAVDLQNAWTARDWRLARPLETNALFQMHRYWIDEYLRQGVKNVANDYSIDRVEVAKVTSDAFYDAITVRLFASGKDHTLNANGDLIGGSSINTKQWSEYWTFVRGRVAGSADSTTCPNCGAERAAGQTAICDYCGGRITSAEFPWVLSRIEQDEAYRG